MARQRRRRRTERQYVWSVYNNDLTKSFSPGVHSQVQQVSAPSDDFNYTIERVLGTITVSGAASSAPDLSMGVISGIVLPDILVGTPTGGDPYPDNFPDPLDNQGTDDWMLFQPYVIPLKDAATSDELAYFSGMESYGFDSKARRNIGRDESLWVGLKNASGSTTIDAVRFILRVLFKLKD